MSYDSTIHTPEYLREFLIMLMNTVAADAKYVNCRLAVQLTIDVPALESLPKITFDEIEIGDVISWGYRHHAIWIGWGDVVQVGGWGESVKVESLKSLKEYWDEPSAYHRSPSLKG